MTYISPLLQSRLGVKAQTQNNNNQPATNAIDHNEHHYNKVYEELRSRANEVKPDEAKAKLVEENPLQAAVSYVKDLKTDVSNLSKAVVTGKLSDFPLGRLNDLGLKAGSLLIAALLAKGSKTKTEAIMKFVGGGAFLASMSVWPKLFINLPARLIHGFRIDEKYISAQGDKKELFLDNQFIPWDAYPKDKLMKNAKRAGISPDEANSEEKIQRKMQKTALQNRTLWMATAGFATPIMTSLFCNRIEPHIQNAVIEHDAKKAMSVLETPETLKQYMQGARPEVQNKSELEALFKSYEHKALGEEFYSELSKLLSLNIKGRSKDDVAVFSDMTTNLSGVLKEIASYQPVYLDDVSLKNFTAALSDAAFTLLEGNNDSLAAFGTGPAVSISKKLEKSDVDSIIEEIKLLTNPTKEVVRKTLIDRGIAKGEAEKLADELKINNTSFFEAIKEFNENILSVIRGRAKSYNKLFNVLAGPRAESVYTKISTDSIAALFKQMNLSDEDLATIAKNASQMVDSDTTKFGFDKGREVLISVFEKFAKETQGLSDEEYAKKLQEFIGNGYKFDVCSAVQKLADKNNIAMIGDIQTTSANKEMFSQLIDAILGQKDEIGSIYDKFIEAIKRQGINLDITQNKILLCANLERRIADGSLKEELKALTQDEGLLKKLINVARSMVYDNSAALQATSADLQEGSQMFNALKKILFNPEKFIPEKGVEITDALKGFRTSATSSLDDILYKLKNIGTDARDYTRGSSFFQAVKNSATSMLNSKNWLKHCGMFGAALVAFTLLCQPFFGKIDKEFPKNADNKEGGAK